MSARAGAAAISIDDGTHVDRRSSGSRCAPWRAAAGTGDAAGRRQARSRRAQVGRTHLSAQEEHSLNGAQAVRGNARGVVPATERGVRLAAAAAWRRLSTRLQYEVKYERSLTWRTPRSLSLATTPRACPHLESTTTTLDMLATSTSSAANASSSGNRTAVLLASSCGSSSTLSSLTCDGASTARCTPVALLRFCCACVMLRGAHSSVSRLTQRGTPAASGHAHVERLERKPDGGHAWRQRQQALAAVIRVGALAARARGALPFRKRHGAGELQALVHGPGLPTWAARAKRVHRWRPNGRGRRGRDT